MKDKILKVLKWIFFSYIWLAVVLFVLDIVTKHVVYNAANGVVGTVVWNTIPGFLNVELVLNEGAAFGLGFDATANRIIYIIVATLGIAIMLFIYIRKFKKLKAIIKACLMMMVCGALGNLIDRLFYSFSNYCVIDWINFHGIWGYHFNIADCGIVIGVIMLIVVLIIEEVKEFKARKALEDAEEERVLSSEEQRREDELKDNDASK